MGRYTLDYRSEDLSTEIHNRDGVSWLQAPRPRRLHLCRPQTIGWMYYFTNIRRCPCGAVSINGGQWRGRNSRRRGATA